MNAHDVGEWIGDHKLAAGGVVAGTLLLFLILRHRSKAASSAGATTDTANPTYALQDAAYQTDPTADTSGGDYTAGGGFFSGGPIFGTGPTPDPSGATVNDGSAAGSVPTNPTGTQLPVGATTGHTSSPTVTTRTGKTPIVRPVVKPKAGTTTHKAAATTTHSYTVRSGDNLSAIAARLHVKGGWQTLYAENKAAVGANPDLIHPGLILKY